MTAPLRLATRGSPLAIAQATIVATKLEARGIAAEFVIVETEGDRRRDETLTAIAGKGVFVKDVQAAVLEGRADAAVHSAKDLPPEAPGGLVLASVPERLDPADALVGSRLAELAPGATVATGAPRRRALLLLERPDLRIVGLRGNIETRLGALGRDVDAVVVAVAALERLGLGDRVAERLDPGRFVPQVGQGAIAVECATDSAAREALFEIDHHAAHAAVRCERAFLAELGAGCEIPGGAIATIEEDGTTWVRGALLTEDGAVVVRGGDRDSDPARAGRALAARLRRALDQAVGRR